MNLLADCKAAGGQRIRDADYLAGGISEQLCISLRSVRRERSRRECRLCSRSWQWATAVVTTSGFYGVIIDITEDDVIVEFGSNRNCRIPMRKAAIAEVEKAGE